MKKRYIAISIMALALIAFIPVSGQTIQQISPWIFGAGNVIKPLNNSSHVQVPSLGSSGDPCIKVDASGNLSTTTCGGTASLTWGSITGTLSSQTDLQNALNAKEPTISTGTTAQYWRGDKSWQSLGGAIFPLLSAISPITYNTSTGSIGWTNSEGYLSSSTGATYFAPSSTVSSQWTSTSTGIYYNGGNVGIGITAPTAQLHLVKADSSALTDFLINPTAKTSGNLIDAQVGGVSKFSVNSAGQIFGKGQAYGTPTFAASDDPTSGFGVPLANPGVLLFYASGSGSFQARPNGYLNFHRWSMLSTGDSAEVVGADQNDATAHGMKIGNENALTTAGGKIVSFYSDGLSTERAYIDYLGGAYFNGNVGIGTTTPATLLDVNGTSTFRTSVILPFITSSSLATDATGKIIAGSASGSFTTSTLAGLTDTSWGLTSTNSLLGISTSTSPSTVSFTMTTTPTFTTINGSTPSNWDTAYTDRLKWDGGSTGLVAATGRTSLGLGTAATFNSTDFLASTTAYVATTTGNWLGTWQSKNASDFLSSSTAYVATTTGTWLGNAGTATKLAATKTINGVAFDGSANIELATPTSGAILVGNGTHFAGSAYTVAAPSTSGNVLTSNGTNWTSAAPTASNPSITLTAGENLSASSSVMIGLGQETTVKQIASSTALSRGFGRASAGNNKQRQQVLVGDINHTVTKINAILSTSGSPTDSVLMNVWDSSFASIISSSTLAAASMTGTSTATSYAFTLSVPVTAQTIYVEFTRTGAASDTNLYNIYSDNGGASYAGSNGESWNLSTWASVGNDYSFTLSYVKTAGLAWAADSTTASTTNSFVGFTQAAVSSGNTATVYTSGPLSGFSGLTAGLPYYLTNTGGVIGTVAGSNSRVVGTAYSSTQIIAKQ